MIGAQVMRRPVQGPRIGRRSPQRRRWLARLWACGAAALALGAVLPSLAVAGPARYIYEVCDSNLPGGGTPEVKFSVNAGVPFTPYNNCAQPGGSIGIAETGHVDTTYSFWKLSLPAPPGGTVESLSFSGAACCGGPGTKAFAYEQGWPAMNAGESQRVFPISGLYLGSPWIYLGCTSSCEAGPSVSVHYVAATEVDPVAPKLQPLQGSLLGGGILRGHQSLDAEASDEGGGLSKVAVVVNGLPADPPTVADCSLAQTKRATVTGTVALSPTPCPAALKSSWTLDTAAYPFQNGVNSVQACASDFSTLNEPNTTCSAPQAIDVDNSCTESPVLGGEVLSAQFARSHREAVTVPYDSPAKVSGELADDAGDAIGGATICVEAQTLGGRRGLRPLATTTTDAHGHFTYTVPPGPNRRVLLGYRHDSFQVARSVLYYAHAKPTLRIAPGEVAPGGHIRLVGRVPGPRAAGRVVVLQASALRSSRWYTFHRATTNRHGVFRSRYRFDATTRTTTYRVRAVVPRQHDYPWEVGHSKSALVTVRAGR